MRESIFNSAQRSMQEQVLKNAERQVREMSSEDLLSVSKVSDPITIPKTRKVEFVELVDGSWKVVSKGE